MSHIINLLEWAEQKKRFEGPFLLRDMARLKPLLYGGGHSVSDAFVSSSLQFSQHPEGFSVLVGQIAGTLTLSCERCQEGVNHAVDHTFRLCLIHDEPGIDSIPSGYEPLLLGDFSGALSDLIEDELILALPMVVFHELEHCALSDTLKAEFWGRKKIEDEKQSPFLILKKG